MALQTFVQMYEQTLARCHHYAKLLDLIRLIEADQINFQTASAQITLNIGRSRRLRLSIRCVMMMVVCMVVTKHLHHHFQG